MNGAPTIPASPATAPPLSSVRRGITNSGRRYESLDFFTIPSLCNRRLRALVFSRPFVLQRKPSGSRAAIVASCNNVQINYNKCQDGETIRHQEGWPASEFRGGSCACLLYTSDAADDLLCVD